MNVIPMVVTMVVTCSDDLINQIIAYRIERYDTLIAATSFFAIGCVIMPCVAVGTQGLDGRGMVGDFIVADDDGVCRTAGVGPFHLRLETAAGIGRSAM